MNTTSKLPLPQLIYRKRATADAPRPVAIVADDDAALVQALSTRLKRLGYEVFRSPDAIHALLGAHHIRPRLMIVDVHMPGGNGISVCDMIYSDSGLKDIAVIVMTGDDDDVVARRCRELGADFVRKGPQLWEEIRQALHKRFPPSSQPGEAPTPADFDYDEPTTAPAGDSLPYTVDPFSSPTRPKILTIDDDPDVTYMLKLRLERLGLEVIEASGGMQGFWKAVECRPQVVTCDLSMPDGEGSYIYGRLATHPVTKDIPVIILTGLSNPALRRHLLGLGVAAFLAKPVVFDELIGELRKHVALPTEAVET